ncbi:MAG: S23 ribosomal protein [uncultured bacterium]|nr:MAG: S23 ribosomal protein [uncultured bacterium]
MDFPKTELYGLTSQMRRSAISMPSNIAEGLFRSTKCEVARHFTIARGSAGELLTQLMIAYGLEYISVVDSRKLQKKALEIIKMLTASIKTLSS